MDNNSILFIAKLNEIKDLYAEVKEVIVLAENFDPSSDVYLSPLTELRNTLDHIMRSFIYPDRLNSEFDEAKEHLYRAGYDAYEVLAINVSNRIVIEKYNTKTIATIFPTYFTEVKQSIINIKIEVAEERAHKRLDPDTGTKSFTPYKEKITKLINHLKVCEHNIPDLQKEKAKGWFTSIANIILGILIAAAGIFVYEKFLAGPAPSKQPLEQTDHAKDKK
jgi:hypothetical protein